MLKRRVGFPPCFRGMIPELVKLVFISRMWLHCLDLCYVMLCSLPYSMELMQWCLKSCKMIQSCTLRLNVLLTLYVTTLLVVSLFPFHEIP